MTFTIKNYSTTGFVFAANGDTIVTQVGGTISNTTGNDTGVYAYGLSGFVYNNGDIAGSFDGIQIGKPGDISTVTVGSSGHVFGFSSGIDLTGNCVINNLGEISGENGISAYNAITPVTVNNAGTIMSVYGGYAYYGSSDFDTVINTGTMVGAVELSSGNDLFDGRGGSVTGVVRGGYGNDVLVGGSGADRLEDTTGSNWIVGGGGDDTITIGSYGAANGTTTAWGGEANFGVDNSTNDTLDVGGYGASIFLGGVVYNAGDGSVAAWIWGFENATGTSYADTIIGTGGNNIINGHGGADWLVGGGGYDQFVFDVVNVNNSQIRDFSHDIIDLHNIDANTTVSGDQAFSYHTNHTSNAAGEMVFTNYGSGGQIDLYTNADNVIDATIYVGYASGNPAPTASDFWL